LPLREGNFDLLISLYSHGIPQFCKKYLKTNGVLLTNHYFNDSKDAMKDSAWKIISVVKKAFHGYKFIKADVDEAEAFLRKRSPARSYLRHTNTGFEYSQGDDLPFLFRKCS